MLNTGIQNNQNSSINILSDNSYNDVYLQLKAILDGCDTLMDALPFCNLYSEKYPHMKSMIFSYTNGKTYKDNIDIKSKQCVLNDINNCTSKDDALNIISKATDRTNDDVYIKTLERIANRKYYKRLETIETTVTNISKKCPHCSHVINMPENTGYVVCGYHNSTLGYDWNGCGRDWCFQCNKMLCKCWEINALNLEMNRFHDDECCLKHSKENNNRYPNDYCQCNSMYVHREHNNILSTIIT